MLSIHVVFGLPLLRHPGVVPCIICFSRLSALFLITCPKYDNFLAFTDSRRFLATSAFSSTQLFVRFAVHDARSIWRSPRISKACILFSSPARMNEALDIYWQIYLLVVFATQSKSLWTSDNVFGAPEMLEIFFAAQEENYNKLKQEAQLPLRNRASATYFFVAKLISIA